MFKYKSPLSRLLEGAGKTKEDDAKDADVSAEDKPEPIADFNALRAALAGGNATNDSYEETDELIPEEKMPDFDDSEPEFKIGTTDAKDISEELPIVAETTDDDISEPKAEDEPETSAPDTSEQEPQAGQAVEYVDDKEQVVTLRLSEDVRTDTDHQESHDTSSDDDQPAPALSVETAQDMSEPQAEHNSPAQPVEVVEPAPEPEPEVEALSPAAPTPVPQPEPEHPEQSVAEPQPEQQAPVQAQLPQDPTPKTEDRRSRVKTTFLGFERADTHVQELIETAEPVAKTEVAQQTFPVGWLVVTTGPGRGASMALTEGLMQIGRNDDQAIQLDFGDTGISRSNHAVIAYDPEDRKCYIGHGGKANLVRLNGKPVLSTVPLSSGDLIRISETTIRFTAFCDEGFDWRDS
ncbi:MAG: FHA domain-containing protein [Pseudomonadota bacterium]